MTQLVELLPETHGDFKVKPTCAIDAARKQHALNIQVAEVARAASSLPVFFTHVQESDEWALSAMTGCELGTNLFIQDDQWQSVYLPTSMQTYPVFLMNKPGDEKNYTLGIFEENAAFSKTEGEALFDDKGAATPYLSHVKAILERGINDIGHTYQFVNKVKELDLFQGLNLRVQYADGRVNTLQGVYTVNEQKLTALSTESYMELRDKGFLPPLFAMLFSLSQLNRIIRKQNETEGMAKIIQIKIETVKDEN